MASAPATKDNQITREATEEEIERGFKRLQRLRFFQKQRKNIENVDFWLSLNPALSINSSEALEGELLTDKIDSHALDQWQDQLNQEGYFQTPPLIPHATCERLAKGMTRLSEEGFPPIFACVYDEFYKGFMGLSRLLAPLLGEDCLFLPFGTIASLIDTNESEAGLGPHRDAPGPDPYLSDTGVPTLLTVWLAITDATPLNGCIYGLPAMHDPCYRYWPPKGRPGHEVNLQKIRALPAKAGSFICWSSHFLHWSGYSSKHAHGPRMSGAIGIQRRDVPPFSLPALELDAAMPFKVRLQWISKYLNDPELIDY